MMTPLFNEVIPTASTAPRRKKGRKKVRKQTPPNEAHPELASKIFMSCLTLLSSSIDKPTTKPTRQRKNNNSATTNTTASTKNSGLWSNNSKSKNINDDPIYKRSSTQQMNLLKKRCSVIRWDQIINPDGSNAFPTDDSNHPNIPSKIDETKAESNKKDQERRMTMEQQQRLSVLSFKIKESMRHEFKQNKKCDKRTSCEHENIQYVKIKSSKSKKDREDYSEVSGLSDDESITFGALKHSRNKALTKSNNKDSPSVERKHKEKFEENTIINALLKDCLTSTEKSIMDTINNLQIDDDDDDDSCFNNDNGRAELCENMRMKRQSSVFIIKRNGSVLVKDSDDFGNDDDIEEGCILVDFGNNYCDDDDDYDNQ